MGKRKCSFGCGVPSALFAMLLLVGLTSCTLVSHGPALPSAGNDWILKDTRRLVANELWKEHNGGDNIYIERGCVSETLSDYRHQNRPWTLRASVFDQSKPDGARSLLTYYHDGVENEIKGSEAIGDAGYMAKSQMMHSWIVGFCKGRFFVEASLVEAGNESVPLSDAGRDALIAFAKDLAGRL